MLLLADRLDLAVTRGVRWEPVARSDQHWTLVGDEDWQMTCWGTWATGLRLPMPIPGRVLPDGTPWQAAAALLCTVCHVVGVADVEQLVVLDVEEVSGG